MIRENYIPDNGVAVFSPNGYQRLQSRSGSSFYFSSEVQTDILIDDKWRIDHIWENNSFYYIDGNKVFKRAYDGTEIASIEMDGPSVVAARQFATPVPNDIQNLYGSDSGCWIVDLVSKELVQTDNKLSPQAKITQLDTPSFVLASADGGCYFFDDGKQCVYKVSQDVVIKDFISFSDVGINDSSDVSSADIDINNDLWIAKGSKIKKIAYQNDSLSLEIDKDLLADLSISKGHISGLSVEKSSTRDNVYAVGCSENEGSWIAKLDLNGKVIISNTNFFAKRLSIVNSSQWGHSGALYVVSDSIHLPFACKDCSCGIGCMAIQEEPYMLTVGGVCHCGIGCMTVEESPYILTVT